MVEIGKVVVALDPQIEDAVRLANSAVFDLSKFGLQENGAGPELIGLGLGCFRVPTWSGLVDPDNLST